IKAMKRFAFALLLAALASSLSASQTATTYDVVLFAKDTMIAMRDGVELATDIYRPSRNGAAVSERMPVLLQRTPYNKESGGLVANAKFFAEHGYVVAVQDIRGRYK